MRLPISLRISYLSLLALALCLTGPLASSSTAQKKPAASKQSKRPATKKPSANAKQQKQNALFATPRKYYRIAGLGSTEGDSVNSFPYPTAVLQLLDTMHTNVIVRFPGLGMLGIREDTVWAPNFSIGDTLAGYASPSPLYLLNFPKTSYQVFVDVFSRDSGKLIDSRPLEYEMNVQKYQTASFSFVHEPTTGLGAPTLRREFKPALLPFTIETNPGWRATETIDSNRVYALVFRHPEDPTHLMMSLTMRPAVVGRVDSAMWETFKDKARLAFGSGGVAVNSIGDFVVADSTTRRFIRAGFEFVSKNPNGSLDYVAAFLTPRAILLMLAPLDAQDQSTWYEYMRSIARSLKVK